MSTPQPAVTSVPLQLTRLTLLSLAALGAFTLQYTARTNNLFTMMEAFQASSLPHTLSDGVTTGYNPAFTGVPAIDHVAQFVLMFFWPILSGGYPGLSLISAAFGAGGAGLWTLLMLEGRRRGDGWSLLAFTAVPGILGQLLGLGFIAPIYLTFHLWSLPLSLSPSPTTLSPKTITSIAAIPATITLAYILPIAIMVLPTPKYITLDTKILAHNTWQIFPLTCALTNSIIAAVWPYNPSPTPKTTLSYLRWVYKFALVVSVPVHIGTATLSLSSVLFPSIFAPGIAGEFHPRNSFFPSSAPFAFEKVRSVADGVLWFLQWDYAIVCASHLVWAVALRALGRKAVGNREALGVGGLLKLGLRTVVLGPVGSAVVYVWERDEVVFGGWEAKQVKKIQ